METEKRKSANSWSIRIDVPIETAWPVMIDYPTWNPGFDDATVITVIAGEKGAEGEVAHIQFGDGTGAITSELIAETIRLAPPHNLTWFVTEVGGDDDERFLDFELVEADTGGVVFNLHYYGLTRTPEPELAAYREQHQQLVENLGAALKEYLEGQDRDVPRNED